MRFTEQWSWCTVEAIRDVTPTIREFRLRPENGHVAPYPAGSHIGVTVLIDGQPARRSYSLVENGDAGTYRIAVRLAPDSRGGSRGMWSLTPGARIETSNPASLLEIDWTQEELLPDRRRHRHHADHRYRSRPAPQEYRRRPALRRQITRRCRLPRRTLGAARRPADRARLRRRRAARSGRHLPRSAG